MNDLNFVPTAQTAAMVHSDGARENPSAVTVHLAHYNGEANHNIDSRTPDTKNDVARTLTDMTEDDVQGVHATGDLDERPTWLETALDDETEIKAGAIQ